MCLGPWFWCGTFSLGVLGGGGRFACLFGWLVFFSDEKLCPRDVHVTGYDPRKEKRKTFTDAHEKLRRAQWIGNGRKVISKDCGGFKARRR